MLWQRRKSIAVLVLLVAVMVSKPARPAWADSIGTVFLDTINQGDDGVYRGVLIWQNQTYVTAPGDYVPDSNAPSFQVTDVSSSAVTYQVTGEGSARTLSLSY